MKRIYIRKESKQILVSLLLCLVILFFKTEGLIEARTQKIERMPAEFSLLAKSSRIAPPKLINGDFEEPNMLTVDSSFLYGVGWARDKWVTIKEEAVPGWRTTDETGTIEFQRQKAYNLIPKSGVQYAELNSYRAAELYQEVPTVPGTKMRWTLWHSSNWIGDKMSVNIGPSRNKKISQATFEVTERLQWALHSGTYIVPENQNQTYFGFESLTEIAGPSVGNFLDNIQFSVISELELTKKVQKAAVTNEKITYTIDVENIGGTTADKIDIHDVIPTGTNYVLGSLKIDNQPMSDLQDSDEAYYKASTNTIHFTPASIDSGAKKTLQFTVEVTALEGEIIENETHASYQDEHFNDSTYQATSNKVTTEVKKELTVHKTVDKNTINSGKELTYTIELMNENLQDMLFSEVTLMDIIPMGSNYVAESMTIDGVAVTDLHDSDNGTFDETNHQLVFQELKIPENTKRVIQFKVQTFSDGITTSIKNQATGSYKTGDSERSPVHFETNAVETTIHPTLHMRQHVKNSNSELVIPNFGYVTLLSSVTALNPINTKVLSSEQLAGLLYKDVLIADSSYEQVNVIVPQYYQYVGYTVSTADVPHGSMPIIRNPIQVDLSLQKEYWITIYIESTTTKPKFNSWDYQSNALGSFIFP